MNWKQVNINIRNWRWWISLPYLIPIAIVLCAMYGIGLSLVFIGALLMQPMDSTKNFLWYKNVLWFVKEGERYE